MPVYVYRCSCGKEQELFRPVSQHTKTVGCDCGGEAKQVLTPLHVIPDIQPYRSMMTGERIKGRSHHREHMRQHNLIEVGNEKVERKVQELPPVAPDIKRAIEELRSR